MNNIDKPEFFITPGFGERLHKSLHYSQAVKIGNVVEISGQGGWTDEIEFPADLREEYALAFANVARVLQAAGASWTDVVAVDSFHVNLDDDAMYLAAELLREHTQGRAPIWTLLGVVRLGDERMRIEIRVKAIVQ